MRHLALLPLLLFVAVSAGMPAPPADSLTRYVDPFIGTGGHGHTYPGATLPFGMVQLSPDNGRSGWDWCSGYHYSDTGIVGFSHTHLSGTGCADLGDISFMPTASSRNLDEAYRSPFSHHQEAAEPGYYRVRLLDHDILVELTATERAGFHRYTFPRSDSAGLIIDLKRGQDDNATNTVLTVADSTLVTGCRFSNGWAADQRVFFAARFSVPFSTWALGPGGAFAPGSPGATGKDVKGIFWFGRTPAGEKILVKVGISSVSADNALRNLDTEIRGWDFDAIRAAASAAWERALGKVLIETSGRETKQVFYTALYHAFLAPTVFSDVNGQYRGADGEIHNAGALPYYSTYSLWDTYRAAHPLYTIVMPERVDGLMQAMLAFSHESGYLPVWQLAANETNTMVGYHAVPPLVDAYLKGFRGFDTMAALSAMEKSAFRDHAGLRFYNAARPEPLSKMMEPQQRGIQDPPSGGPFFGVAGYARSLEGESIGYGSPDPEAGHALIVRAADGKKPIAWETAPVSSPPHEGLTGENAPVSLVWIAGLAAGKGAHSFTLWVNDDSLLSFRSAVSSSRGSWAAAGPGGAQLMFNATMTDRNGDLFGNMVLTLPASRIRPGSPFRLRITGEAAHASDWCMVFEYPLAADTKAANVFGLYTADGRQMQLVRVDADYLGAPRHVQLSVTGGDSVQAVVGTGHNTLYVPIPAVQEPRLAHVALYASGRRLWHDTLRLRPVRPYGYIPADKENESVSKTLEYAIDDFCISRMASALGKADDAALFRKRSMNYRNLFDTTTGFFRGRRTDGSWVSPFNPRFSTEKQPEYTEGNAWQYLWLAPHDVPGLVSLLGGRDRFDIRLDSLFNQSSNLEGTGAPPDVSGLIGLYAHGNEPSHHIAYLYDYDGRPWKTQAMVQRIMGEFYKTGPEGLCGNEDCGQMSAWYVFSAMGFYPVTPVGGVYAIGSPVLEKAVIASGHGRTFTVVARNLSKTAIYIQSAELNGHPLAGPWITHGDLTAGGTLTLVMGDRPNTTWGAAPASAPPMLPPGPLAK